MLLSFSCTAVLAGGSPAAPAATLGAAVPLVSSAFLILPSMTRVGTVGLGVDGMPEDFGEEFVETCGEAVWPGGRQLVDMAEDDGGGLPGLKVDGQDGAALVVLPRPPGGVGPQVLAAPGFRHR